MPQKRTKNTAGAETGTEAEESPQDVEAKLNALVEELEVEVQARCTLLQSDAERMAACIRSEYRMQLEKLPKKIRNMTVSEFFQQHAGIDLQLPELNALAQKYQNSSEHAAEEDAPVRTPLKVVTNANGTSTVMRSTRTKSRVEPGDNQRKRAAAEVEEAPAENARATRRTAKAQAVVNTPAATNGKTQSVVAQTPGFCRELPFTPAHHGAGTVLRLPKRGESIFSMRGSPVAVVSSDASAQVILDGHNKIAALAVGLGNGEEVNVADPAVCAKLPKDARLKAVQNVMAMQQQLEAMLVQLRS